MYMFIQNVITCGNHGMQIVDLFYFVSPFKVFYLISDHRKMLTSQHWMIRIFLFRSKSSQPFPPEIKNPCWLVYMIMINRIMLLIIIMTSSCAMCIVIIDLHVTWTRGSNTIKVDVLEIRNENADTKFYHTSNRLKAKLLL